MTTSTPGLPSLHQLGSVALLSAYRYQTKHFAREAERAASLLDKTYKAMKTLCVDPYEAGHTTKGA